MASKRRVRQRDVLGVALDQVDVEALGLDAAPAAVEQRRHVVDADDVAAVAGRGDGRVAAAAGDVEHAPAGLRVDGVDERVGDGLDQRRDGVEVAARPHRLLALLDLAQVGRRRRRLGDRHRLLPSNLVDGSKVRRRRRSGIGARYPSSAGAVPISPARGYRAAQTRMGSGDYRCGDDLAGRAGGRLAARCGHERALAEGGDPGRAARVAGRARGARSRRGSSRACRGRGASASGTRRCTASSAPRRTSRRSRSTISTARSRRSRTRSAAARPRGGGRCCSTCSAARPTPRPRSSGGCSRASCGRARSRASWSTPSRRRPACPRELARRALMLSGDLTRTAELALAGGEEALRGVGFELFRPVFPMLASTAESVAAALEGFELASVEWKLDGIRIQIHRRGDEVRIYTRNLNEITASLPGIVEAVRELPVAQAVLDGEALWMGEDGPAAFQDTVAQTRRGRGAGVPLRRAARRRRGPARHAAGRARRAARRDRARARGAARAHRRPRRGPARARRGARRGARGRGRQGRGVAVRRRPPRQGVAQGEAGADLRPGRARRGVGPRPPQGRLSNLHLGARDPERRLRHGRQDASRA